MDFTKLLRALLSKVYKKTDTEIDAILGATDEAAAESQILEIDRNRVSELSKPKPGSTFQDGYAKAKKEVLTGIELKLKETFEIEDGDTPLTGDDLISAIAEKKAASAGPDATKLTADDIKKLPAFQPIQRAFNQQLNQVKTEADNKVQAIETANKKAEVFGGVSKKALETLNGLNPVLPKTPTVAEKQKSSFLNDLKGFDWELQGDVFVPMKEGKVVTDDHGNALTLEDITKKTAAEWFEFSQNNGGTNAGNGKAGEGGGANGGGGITYPANIAKPKTLEEYSAIVNNTTIPLADRKTVAQVWETEQANGTK